jgi:hypothetical protein
MRFQTPLLPARLLRRYKRFLADVLLEDGREVTAHCPNPGAMMGLAEPGMRIWLEPNDDPRKKLKFGWRLVELPGGHMAGIDTAVPEPHRGEALAEGRIDGRSAATGPSGPSNATARTAASISFFPSRGGPDAYVEVKNVHLRRDGDWAEFPDCVTARGCQASGGAWPHRARRGAGGDALRRAAHRLRALPPRARPRSRLCGGLRRGARGRGRDDVPRHRDFAGWCFLGRGPLPVDPAEQAGRLASRNVDWKSSRKDLSLAAGRRPPETGFGRLQRPLTKDGIRIHAPEDFAGMHAAGRIAADILDRVAPMVVPGATTGEIDAAIERWWRMPARPRPRSGIAAISTPAASR